MVEWLAGNRIRGTSTERTVGTPEVPAISGGWKELGRTTLGSAGDTIDVTGLADKRYLMILGSKIPSGNSDLVYRFNSDSASNYAIRFSDNGGSHGTGTSQGRVLGDNGGATTPSFQVGYVANKSDQEKMIINQAVGQSTAGAGNAPIRRESTGKWVNTSNTISSVQGIQQEGGDLASGSEVVVLGYDPDDTHTDNFWEELASVENSGGSTNNFGTGSFTAKKYLWIQAFVKNDGLVEPRIRVGTGGSIDTGSNIATRSSSNGGADGTATSRDDMVVSISGTSENHLINMFMVNNASNEKLAIHDCVSVGTAGAGTAPQRREGVSKYSNTSAQVNIIEIEDNAVSAGIANGTFIKVWGAD